MAKQPKPKPDKNIYTHHVLRKHFHKTPLSELVVATRTFMSRVRVDLQSALREMLDGSPNVVYFSGARKDYGKLDFGALTMDSSTAPVACPAEFDAIDVGESEPVRCLKTGLWLLEEEGNRFAILLAPTDRFEEDISATRFFVATCNNAKGEAIANRFFRQLEDAVKKSRSYRGKVLSLERGAQFSGRGTGIMVHKLPAVSREDLILPAITIELLDRNVINFAKHRAELRAHGQTLKKGLLFYGPPGTGKTHTIRYLARALSGHTTLLITAEQVGSLREYMTLARLLQPSVVVIEDADLIARERKSSQDINQEALLNKLLNEMDGLREDAEIIFILTSNRPEVLEAALASRPGRIDQSIEFPLPDALSRQKLVEVYGRGLLLADDVTEMIVNRTNGVSGAFIKELMRRSLQFRLERDPNQNAPITSVDVVAALEEILFKGGKLNVTLLGGNPDLTAS